MRYLVCASCDPSGNFDMVYLKKTLKNSKGGLCFNDPFSLFLDQNIQWYIYLESARVALQNGV